MTDPLRPNQFDHDDYKPSEVRSFIVCMTAVAVLIACAVALIIWKLAGG